jgi:hypothetical protein
MVDPDIQRAQREHARWRLLMAIYSGRPYAVGEAVIGLVLNDSRLYLSPAELRIELDYLKLRELVNVRVSGANVWEASLTRLGIDLVEYTVDCDPGIARPPRA